MNMRNALAVAVIWAVTLGGGVSARQSEGKLSPTETVRRFYSLLREKKFVEAFRFHVCAPAVEKLSPEQIKELSPDFENLAAGIPENFKVGGETVSGEDATVYVKVPLGVEVKGVPQTESAPVNLIFVDGRWIIGDRDTQALAYVHKSQFFFLSRQGVFAEMAENENYVAQVVAKLVDIQLALARNNRGVYATLPEIVAQRDFLREDLRAVVPYFETGEFRGYAIETAVSDDRRNFAVHATPKRHNYDGRYSYFGDKDGVRYKNNGGLRLEKNAPGAAPVR